MDKTRILLLEDNPRDAELIEFTVNCDGNDFEFQREDTEKGFQKALAQFMPDIVVSDYKLPT